PGSRVVGLRAGRGIASPADLDAFFADPLEALHDPSLLPDAGVFRERIAAARRAGERVFVFGDFDADGLTGLAILVRTLRRLGVDAVPYVPSRLDEGHGLSRKAIAAALEAGARVIVTVDCGTTSLPEIGEARAAGIADLTPILGETRAIVRLGLAAIARAPRPGVAALLAAASIAPERVDVETLSFALAPRINAAGRVGESPAAVSLLLTDDRAEADR